jgi:hypothetical protein
MSKKKKTKKRIFKTPNEGYQPRDNPRPSSSIASGGLLNQERNKSLQTLSPREKRRIRIEVLFFSITGLILMLIVFEKYVNSRNVPLPISILWRAVVVALIIIRSGGNRVILKSMDNHRDYADVPVPVGFQKAMRLISVVIIAIIVFPAIYYSPLREQMSIFLVNFQAFSKDLANNISTTLSIVLAAISGHIIEIVISVIGNLIFKIIESAYIKLRPENNRSTSKKRK